jgi:catechol 2,3-dioxygenase-like lactoylglutathione lyase family enzyme
MIRITVASVFVDDQAKALAFYTEKLGFAEKRNIPLGEFSWLTVVSPAEPDGVELLLEPNDNALAATFQRGIYDAGIPATTFRVDDIDAEYARLTGLGVAFTSEPADQGPVRAAVLDDTCGNLIQLHQEL